MPYKLQSSKSIFDLTLRESIHIEAHQKKNKKNKT